MQSQFQPRPQNARNPCGPAAVEHAKVLIESFGLYTTLLLARSCAGGFPRGAYWREVLAAVNARRAPEDTSRLEDKSTDAPVDVEIYRDVSDTLRRVARALEGRSGEAEPPLPLWRRFTRHWLAGVCSRRDATRARDEAQAECQRFAGREVEAAAWCAMAAFDAMRGDERSAHQNLDRANRLIATNGAQRSGPLEGPVNHGHPTGSH
jgi:hypothetical protein